MPIELIALPPKEVRIDDSRYPDRDDSWIFDHLRQYCSLIETLPAIRVLVDDKGPVVTWGHKYLRIANDLGREQIRALIQPGSDPSAKAALLTRSDVEKLDWDEIDTLERATPVVGQWHVFYFDRPLSADEKDRFDQDVAAFFLTAPRPAWDDIEEIVSDVQHDDIEHRAQFLARTPVADESWYGPFLAVVKTFASRVATVVSYQGRRFDA